MVVHPCFCVWGQAKHITYNYYYMGLPWDPAAPATAPSHHGLTLHRYGIPNKLVAPLNFDTWSFTAVWVLRYGPHASHGIIMGAH